MPVFDLPDRLAHPYWLILLVLLPLPYLFERLRARLQWPALERFRGHRRGGAGWLRQISIVLKVGIIACLVVALARPQSVAGRTRIASKGVAIVLVLDNSSSMNARDFLTEDRQLISRIDAAKRTIDRFVEGRPDDLIGLVLFANYPDLACPPTLDRETLRLLVQQVETARPGEDGTNIGDALAWGLDAVLEASPDQKVLVLLSDGHNEPAVPNPLDPEAAARLARDLGVTLHTIAVGREGGTIPVWEPTTDLPITVEVEGPDLEQLEELARLGGGRAYQATSAQALDEIFNEIDRLERSPLTGIIRTRYREEFAPWVALALVLMVLDRVLFAGRLRRLP